MSKISKFCNFWAISTCNTSKERIFIIEFNFTQKKYDLFEKFLKKIIFCQKISKLSLSVLGRGFEIKSHQRRPHYLNSLRNGRQLAARGGLPEPPPSLIRFKNMKISILLHKLAFSTSRVETPHKSCPFLGT